MKTCRDPELCLLLASSWSLYMSFDREDGSITFPRNIAERIKEQKKRRKNATKSRERERERVLLVAEPTGVVFVAG
jgi:hypothetical protein